MKALGIDIGTTTISSIILDGENGEVLGSRTVLNDSAVQGQDFERLLNPELIWEKSCEVVEDLIRTWGPVDSIGTTGQMHGMLYLDEEGNPVSPLYTWQDGRGDLPYRDGKTYAEYLADVTGIWMATGFGLTTHFYNMVNGLVPENAVKMTTIGDFIGMKLCGAKEPFISGGNAASWGCFNLEEGRFYTEELIRAGVNPDLLPEVINDSRTIGSTPEGVPVSVSLGDNQAGVIGCVKDLKSSVLINVGTSGQVSFGMDRFVKSAGDIELRPCTDGMYFLAGSALCGGRAYAMLEQFFRDVVRMAGGDAAPLYSEMAKELTNRPPYKDKLKITTKFSGTRSNPEDRGAIENISPLNFTVSNFILGMMEGIAGELHDMYDEMCSLKGEGGTYLIGAGNGLRKNPILRSVFEEMFGMKMEIPAHVEEASYGAALFSLKAAGKFDSLEEAQQMIRYQ